MTTISDLKTAYTAENLDTESLKNSMADMMNSLVETDKKGSTIGNEEMGEDFVYTSLVYDQLKKTDSSLADTFKKRISKVFNKLNSEDTREAQPLFKAANRILRNMVGNEKITGKISRVIKRVAFGKSQLDDKENRLRRNPVVVDESTSKNNVEEVIDKITTNDVASLTQFQKMRDRVAGKTESVETWESKQSFLDGLKIASPSVKVPEVNTVDNETTEDDKINVFKGETNEMIFDPKSEYGKPVFILPHLYSNIKQVAEIKMADTNGGELGKLIFGGVEEDVTNDDYARKFYYFDEDMELPSKISILMRFDGKDEWFSETFRTDTMSSIKYKNS